MLCQRLKTREDHLLRGVIRDFSSVNDGALHDIKQNVQIIYMYVKSQSNGAHSENASPQRRLLTHRAHVVGWYTRADRPAEECDRPAPVLALEQRARQEQPGFVGAVDGDDERVGHDFVGHDDGGEWCERRHHGAGPEGGCGQGGALGFGCALDEITCAV